MEDNNTTRLVELLNKFSGRSNLREACISFLEGFKFHLGKGSPAKYKRGSTNDMPLTQFLVPEFIDKNPDLVAKILTISYVGGATSTTFIQSNPSLSLDEVETKINNDHYNGIVFFCIDVDAELKRPEVVAISRAFNRRMQHKPVVLFIRFNDYLTLTTCERIEAIKKGYVGEKVGKVTILKNIYCKEGKAHPGHINILKELSLSKIDPSFDELYDNWLKTFDNELLTKKFYQELSDWYAWAIKEVRFPNNILDPNDNSKYNHENVIRLVTRLIFVWFLKEKHLIPEEFFKEKYIREHLIQDFNQMFPNIFFFKKLFD